MYFVCFIVRTRPISALGLIVGIGGGTFIALVAVVSLSIYCATKMNRRSAASSASNKYRERSDQTAMEKQDTNITHNSAYGQIKECQLTQDGDVVYEKIEDNCLYDEIQVNMAYGDNSQL